MIQVSYPVLFCPADRYGVVVICSVLQKTSVFASAVITPSVCDTKIWSYKICAGQRPIYFTVVILRYILKTVGLSHDSCLILKTHEFHEVTSLDKIENMKCSWWCKTFWAWYMYSYAWIMWRMLRYRVQTWFSIHITFARSRGRFSTSPEGSCKC